jgi:hypothetical protein
VGFGLSDGEGCERFWSAIKPLIPSLRVSGVRCTFTFVRLLFNSLASIINVYLSSMNK